jgi:hypothetical protein
MRALAFVAATVLLLGGCAQQPTPSVAVSSPTLLPGSTVQASGFLGDYRQFVRVPGQIDSWQWVKPGVNWRQYTRVLIAPVEVWINPDADYRGFQPELYKQMVDTFRTITAQAFRAGGYEVVDKPGPGVLKLHYALTGVTPERPGFTPLDVLPIKIAIDVARRATDTDKTVVVISGEVEALDGMTNERLFAQVATRRDPHLFLGKQLTWDDVRDGANTWAKLSVQRLDQARAAPR